MTRHYKPIRRPAKEANKIKFAEAYRFPEPEFFRERRNYIKEEGDTK